MSISVYRKEHFNAAHRLYNPDWPDEKNELIFGKCNNPNWHGHNYELLVKLVGDVDPETGYVYDLKKLSELIKENIIEYFDHKNLNLDLSEFENLIPTTENIAMVIWNILREKIDNKFQLKVILYETENNFVEFPA